MAQEAVVHRLAFQTGHLHATCRECDEPLPARRPPSVCHVHRVPAWRQSARCCPISGPSDDPGARARVVARHGPAAARQARHRLRAGGLWPHRRCAGAEGQHGAARRPAGPGDRLWPAARRLRRVRRAARRAVRQGAAARGAHRRAAHLPSICTRSACASISTARPARWPARSIAARRASSRCCGSRCSTWCRRSSNCCWSPRSSGACSTGASPRSPSPRW